MPEDADGRRQELGQFIRAQRSSHRLSLRRLSDVSGISNPYLSQIERGLRKPSAEVLQRIARALAVPTEELYVRAGILESNAGGDLVGHILRDPILNEDQKGALVELYLKYRGPSGPLSGEQGPGGPLSGEQGPSGPLSGEQAAEGEDRAPG